MPSQPPASHSHPPHEALSSHPPHEASSSHSPAEAHPSSSPYLPAASPERSPQESTSSPLPPQPHETSSSPHPSEPPLPPPDDMRQPDSADLSQVNAQETTSSLSEQPKEEPGMDTSSKDESGQDIDGS